jgi:hypothetical protein
VISLHHTTGNKISRLLKEYVRTVHIPKRKTAQMLRSANDGLELKAPGVDRTPSECGKAYVGQSGRTVECKEVRDTNKRLYQPEKSAVVDWSGFL